MSCFALAINPKQLVPAALFGKTMGAYFFILKLRHRRRWDGFLSTIEIERQNKAPYIIY